MTLRVLISTGEVSGDIVGARLAAEIRAKSPEATLYGIGGPRMAAAGVDVNVQTNHLGTVGISEAFATATPLYRAFRKLAKRVAVEKPDVAVLIGNDVFNVLLARWLKRRGVKTVSYFPPQVWIWRSLARPIVRSFDALLTCFPEEQVVYRRAGGAASFVGHYLGDALSAATPQERSEARRTLGQSDAVRLVGLLPGSRTHEVAKLAPVLLAAAREIARRDPAVRFALPVAEPSFRSALEDEVRRVGLEAFVTLGEGSHTVMRAADLVLLASGTASLEAALLRVPMVILYRVSLLTIGVVRACIALRLIDSDTVGLPNLVLGRRAVPELIQKKVNAHELAEAAWEVLSSPARQEEMKKDLDEVARRIRSGGSVARAAEAVLALAEAPWPRTVDGLDVSLPEGAVSAERSGLGHAHARDDR